MTDFRSDTVTRPSREMRAAMLAAPVGDDVFGDDPSVNQLEQLLAEGLGFEAGLFAPSGTQSNLMGIMSQCARGDELIVGQGAHTYRWEGGGVAVLGSIQPQPLDNAADGSIPLDRVLAAIKPDDPHFARTRMLALENTIQGKVLTTAYLDQARELVRQAGLRFHLDGARLFNAAAYQAAIHNDKPDHAQVMAAARQICKGFDSVSVCLSKGLGAPVGSVLLGSGETIRAARRVRKMLGGGMRQAGVLAAAGQYALSSNLVRLLDDHRLAHRLASGLSEMVAASGKAEEIQIETPQTNMVFVTLAADPGELICQGLKAAGIGFTGGSAGAGRIRQRWVTHLDVTDADVDRVLENWQALLNK